MIKGTLAAMALTTFFAIPAARADEPPQLASRFAAGGGVMSSTDNTTAITRWRLHLSPEFTFGRLTIAPILRVSSTRIDLHEKDGLPADMTLSLPWQPSLGARVDVRAFSVVGIDVGARVEFDSPIGGNAARISAFEPKRELKDAGVTHEDIRSHVEIDHAWRSFSAAATFERRFGRWTPTLDLGFLSIESSLTARFDAAATALLEKAKASPNRFYGDSTASPFYIVGLKVDLGEGFAIRSNGTFIPKSDGAYVMGELHLLIPFEGAK